MKWSLALALPALLVACSEAPRRLSAATSKANTCALPRRSPARWRSSTCSAATGRGAGAPLFVLESEQEPPRAPKPRRAWRRRRPVGRPREGRRRRRSPPCARSSRRRRPRSSNRGRSRRAAQARRRQVPAAAAPRRSARARDRDRARVAELAAQVRVANLPARPDEIAAARAEAEGGARRARAGALAPRPEGAGCAGRRARRRHALPPRRMGRRRARRWSRCCRRAT